MYEYMISQKSVSYTKNVIKISAFSFLILNIETFQTMAGFEIPGNTETGNSQGKLIECRIYTTKRHSIFTGEFSPERFSFS